MTFVGFEDPGPSRIAQVFSSPDVNNTEVFKEFFGGLDSLRSPIHAVVRADVQAVDSRLLK